jgi:ABC-type hemin transport system substrate-binding protein
MVAMKKLLGLIAFFSLSLECIAQTCVAAKDPSRLSIAGGSLTEILYLIGAEKQIVAVDVTQSTRIALDRLCKKPIDRGYSLA